MGRMLRPHHIVIQAVWGLVVLVNLGVPGESAGQVTVDRSHATRAQILAEGWARGGRVDLAAVTPMQVRGCLGVLVTIRLDGITLGQAQALNPAVTDGQIAESPVDLSQLLSQAMDEALRQAEDRLADPDLRVTLSLNAPGLDETALSAAAGRMTVGVQVGHTLEPIYLLQGSPLVEVFDHFVPGYHGVRSEIVATGESAVIWPAQALSANLTDQRQLRRLMGELDRGPDHWAALGRPGQDLVQRFEVFHVVRPSQNEATVSLVRGQVELPLQAIGEATVNDIARRLQLHLQGRINATGVLSGTLHPSTGLYDPLVADEATALLTAYALMRRAATELAIQERPLGHHEAQAKAQRVLAMSVQNGSWVHAPASMPVSAGLALMVWSASPAEIPADWPAPIANALMASQGEDERFYDPVSGEAWADPIQAMLIAALALYSEKADELEAGQARDAAVGSLQAWWRAQPEGQPGSLNSLMWIALAQQRLDAAGHWLHAPDEARAFAHQLAAQMTLLGDQQVIGPPPMGPADVFGGIEITPGNPGTAPRPDWRTAQGLWLLAAGLRIDPVHRLQQRVGWRLTAELAARFTGQLMMDERNTWYVHQRRLAQGGVRVSLTDNRLDALNTAVALVAFSELQMLQAERGD